MPAAQPTIEYLSPVSESGFPDEWYDLSDDRHFWMQWRLAVALRLVEASGVTLDSPLLALDIGGGAGRFREQVERATRWRVDMTDLNLKALQLAGPARGRTLYYDVTQDQRPLLGAYDVCFLFDVIEHVANPARLVRAAVEHLRPGGHLFVNVPALQAFFSAYDVAAGHLRRYSRRSLTAELDGLGCRLTGVQYWGLGLLPLLALRRAIVGRRPDANTIRAGFEPPNALANAALKALMKAELTLFRRPPLGTSVMASVERQGA
jgi:SAM-dependent methyltransferase